MIIPIPVISIDGDVHTAQPASYNKDGITVGVVQDRASYADLTIRVIRGMTPLKWRGPEGFDSETADFNAFQ